MHDAMRANLTEALEVLAPEEPEETVEGDGDSDGSVEMEEGARQGLVSLELVFADVKLD